MGSFAVPRHRPYRPHRRWLEHAGCCWPRPVHGSRLRWNLPSRSIVGVAHARVGSTPGVCDTPSFFPVSPARANRRASARRRQCRHPRPTKLDRENYYKSANYFPAIVKSLKVDAAPFADTVQVMTVDGCCMKNKIEKTVGPIWGVAAGLLLAVAGLSLGIFPQSLNSSGSANDFMASGVAMLGIFLVVYSTHELRRRRPH